MSRGDIAGDHVQAAIAGKVRGNHCLGWKALGYYVTHPFGAGLILNVAGQGKEGYERQSPFSHFSRGEHITLTTIGRPGFPSGGSNAAKDELTGLEGSGHGVRGSGGRRGSGGLGVGWLSLQSGMAVTRHAGLHNRDGCSGVAFSALPLESTGVYWQPVWNILEQPSGPLDLLLVPPASEGVARSSDGCSTGCCGSVSCRRPKSASCAIWCGGPCTSWRRETAAYMKCDTTV
jgi:hypothetical protein